MTIQQQLQTASQRLNEAGVQTARLDAIILLEDVLGVDRSWLLAHDDAEIMDAQMAKLEKLLTRRANHEPLAYIRGFSEFYGRRFVVSPAVLEPRPESEAMIDCLKQLFAEGKLPVQGHPKTCIADVGTGSGALGITASLELTGCQIELIDIDPSALEIAKTNVDLLTSKISVILSDLLESSSQDNDVLLCNLPYVPDDYQINQAATYEPAIALFAGSDGLDLYRKLFKQLSERPNQPLYILTESLPEQHEALSALAEQTSYELVKTDDFIQVYCRNK